MQFYESASEIYYYHCLQMREGAARPAHRGAAPYRCWSWSWCSPACRWCPSSRSSTSTPSPASVSWSSWCWTSKFLCWGKHFRWQLDTDIIFMNHIQSLHLILMEQSSIRCNEILLLGRSILHMPRSHSREMLTMEYCKNASVTHFNAGYVPNTNKH